MPILRERRGGHKKDPLLGNPIREFRPDGLVRFTHTVTSDYDDPLLDQSMEKHPPEASTLTASSPAKLSPHGFDLGYPLLSPRFVPLNAPDHRAAELYERAGSMRHGPTLTGPKPNKVGEVTRHQEPALPSLERES